MLPAGQGLFAAGLVAGLVAGFFAGLFAVGLCLVALVLLVAFVLGKGLCLTGLDGLGPCGNHIAFGVLEVGDLLDGNLRNRYFFAFLLAAGFLSLRLAFLAAGLATVLAAFGLVAAGGSFLVAGLVFTAALFGAAGFFGLAFLAARHLAFGLQEHYDMLLAGLGAHHFAAFDFEGFGADALRADGSCIFNGECNYCILGAGYESGHFILAFATGGCSQDTESQCADHQNLFHIH